MLSQKIVGMDVGDLTPIVVSASFFVIAFEFWSIFETIYPNCLY